MNNEIIISNLNPDEITITQQDNQTILIGGGGNVIGITDVLVNDESVVSGNIAYVIVPTKLSELQNDTHFLTSETDPTVPSYVKQISIADINSWNNKQNTLVSGSTIKTINNETLLGEGNINITGIQYSAGTGIDITNDIISNEITSYNDLTDLPTIPTKVSDLINDSDYVSSNALSEVAFDGSYVSLSNTPEYTSDFINDGDGTNPFLLNKASGYIDGIGTVGGGGSQDKNLYYTWDNGVTSESHTVANYDDLTSGLATKQDTLVSGSNIKTINNNSLIGNGNIEILDNYSTSETLIGKWIDGSYIYRQVFNIGALVNQDSLTVGTPSMPNNADVVKIYGFCTRNDHAETFPIPFSWGSSTTVTDFVGLFYDYNNKRIYIRTNRYMSNYNAYVIIEYIKTS